ncbi:MAG: heme peroxidase, partial [Planctomycetes bacterium]|nr:heme peroxidase [Planctomycetota bacterium]
HNRLVAHAKDIILATAAGGDVSFLNEWLLVPVAAVPADLSTLVWKGQRLFQAARFGTEMQYQHLVFEEFARTIQPNIDVFIPNLQNYQTEIDPSIVAEFAHTVYRFGHSMLNETVNRLDPDFASSDIGLIQAFLNPLEFVAGGLTPDEAAGALVRGLTRQVGNAIDEFVTEALRNNLLGLPLDLAAINIARGRDTGVPPLQAARRQFYAMTGDNQLAPYTSWADFAGNLKHPESLVNFIAAYGTHPRITAEATLAGKRAAAALLVLGGPGEPADRLDFLDSTGAWVSGPEGVTTTGLDDVDFWIGGLAERIMPFGGMLGSTFNFVFETQLEALQNGDRFYYLERTAGLNFVTELENNSFAKMVMNTTDAIHLPGLIFQTVGLTLEVDPTRQFNDGLGNADPDGDVIRDDPATPGADTNYLQYTGDEHVVMGGTDDADTIIGSIGDDTIWGDGGNDRIDGGDGNDQLRGGPGDDIITDTGGDDNLQGDDGNDVLHGGNGLNLILGGFGQDFIVTGEDASEAFGGPGNDFILGSDNNEQDLGNEGDDWLQGGLLDGSPGDNFDPLGRDLIIGNDVYIGSGLADIMNAEGGDDIMVGSAGPGDKYLGASGFDWATFKDDLFGVTIDLAIDALDAGPVPAAAGILARFSAVEGLSGSSHNDILFGDDADATTLPTAGLQGSVLTNITLISGLQEFLGAGVTSFGAGNIILGGSGSDILVGRGGDDLIDGDLWLNVRISVRQNADGTGDEIDSYDSMVPLVPLMLDGTYNPGQLVIVREILAGDDGFDTAVFSDVRANYDITVTDGVVTVSHQVGGGGGGGVSDGTDRLTNIERLQFADQVVIIDPGTNAEPEGLLTISDTTPSLLQTLTASAAGVSDGDGLGAISYVWQVERNPGSGIFEDILTPTGVGVSRAMGPTFRPTPDLVGLAIRVQGIYQDGNGTLEIVNSAPTAPVAATTPTVAQPIADVETIEDAAPVVIDLTGVFADADSANGDVLTFAAVSANPALVSAAVAGNQLTLTLVPNANGTAEVSVTATDLAGLSVTDTFSVTVQPVADAPTLVTPIPDMLLVTGDAPVVVNLADAFTDVDMPGDTLTFSAISSNPAVVTVSVDGDLLTLQANGFGGVLVIVTATDSGGLIAETTFAVRAGAQHVVQLPANGRAVNRTVVTRAGNALRVINNGRRLLNVPLAEALGLTIIGVDGKSDVVTVNAGAGLGLSLPGGISFDGMGGAGVDTLAVRGTRGEDTLAVSANAVEIASAVANMSISFAGIENLSLNGLGGADTYAISSLPANAAIAASAGRDTLDFSTAATGVTVNLGSRAPQNVFAGVANTLTLATPAAAENVIGTSLGDSITGSQLANRIFGGAGDDVINGQRGNDLIFGQLGDDTFLDDTGNNVLVGGDGNDVFRPLAGRNVLIGGQGTDDLDGAAGHDLLIGGQTAYDDSEVDLLAIARAWARGGSINAKVNALTRGLGRSGTPFLRLGESVLDDGLANTLSGGLGADWFLGNCDWVTDLGASDR